MANELFSNIFFNKHDKDCIKLTTSGRRGTMGTLSFGACHFFTMAAQLTVCLPTSIILGSTFNIYNFVMHTFYFLAGAHHAPQVWGMIDRRAC